MASSFTLHHPLPLVWHYSLPMVLKLRVPRTGLPVPVLAQAPMSPTAPPPSSGYPGEGSLTPVPHQTLGPAQARSAPLLHPSSPVVLVVTAAWAARRPYICLSGSDLETFT